MNREGSTQFSEIPQEFSRDEVFMKIMEAQENLNQAQEDLQSAVPANYQERIRARDVATAELKKWEQTPFAMNLEELTLELERADRSLKHAQNQKEYEDAMRETDRIKKAISKLNNTD